MAGIVTYGASVPRYRIRTEDIAEQWGEDPSKPVDGLNVREKTVPGPDEDTTTLSVEATRIALDRAPGVDPESIGSIFVGSESHVYAVKPTATIIAEAVGASPNMTAADFEFACKAGTAAIQATQGLAASGMVDHGVAVGADTSQGAPGDALEYAAAAGAASFLVGTDDVVAEINHTKSFTSDTPDFWRREGQRYPSHGGRFTGEPAYFRHVVEASQALMEEAGTEPADYDYAVFHQPNGKFPAKVAESLGFNEKQYETGLLAPRIGNTYSGASLLGLANILDVARPGDRIYLNAYGSGAGSDAFDITVTPEITDLVRADTPSLEDQIQDKEYVSYATYAKFREKIEEGA